MRIGSTWGVVGWACLGAIVAADGPRAHPLTPISLQQLIDTTPAGGTLDLPGGPGLGVVLDEAKLSKYRFDPAHV